ncbi:hypothetical protein DZG01_25145 [Pseudomonas fluorescens]|nr:hypothetical protein DZG01_25145 [Pseudomonas fluorescens]
MADIPVGASLLAIAELHSTSMLTDTPPSRAGSLPQLGLRCFSNYNLHETLDVIQPSHTPGQDHQPPRTRGAAAQGHGRR